MGLKTIHKGDLVSIYNKNLIGIVLDDSYHEAREVMFMNSLNVIVIEKVFNPFVNQIINTLKE
jgi:hypothetical protein